MSDYQDALQNPRLSFSDPELQKGVSVTDKLGLPKPITGGFASVYQVNCDGHKWAVRCFLHYHQDMEQRYASIGRTLEEARLPYTAGFQYLKNGVKIRGQWYPALKMEWVDGEPLNSYVERIRNDGESLSRLAQEFTRMTRELRRCNIAHGDLQHGNVMVVGGSLRLVDYDGMFVPPLRGMPSHEVGHPNYQHPRRNDRDFGPYLDNFSEWVIYLSIVALSVQPELWGIAGGGDEQLLLNREDFADPRSSRILKAMSESPSDYLRQMTGTFRSVLACTDIAKIPCIDASWSLPAPVSPRTWVVAGSASTAGQTGQADPSYTSGQANGNLPSWVLDHMDAEPVDLAPPFAVERAALGLSVFVAITLGRFAALGHVASQIAVWGSAAGAATAAVAIVVRYRGRPEFLRKTSLLVQVRGTKREIRRIEGSIRQLERDKDKLKGREDRSLGNLNAKMSDLSSQESEELTAVDAWLFRMQAAIAERREELSKAEAAELAKVANSIPILFLAKRVQSIMKYYRGKRDPLQQQEERVKAEASRKKAAISAKYSRKEGPVLRRLDEAKSSFGTDKVHLDGLLERASQQLALQKWSLHNLSRELGLYSKITLVRFVRRVLFLRD